MAVESDIIMQSYQPLANNPSNMVQSNQPMQQQQFQQPQMLQPQFVYQPTMVASSQPIHQHPGNQIHMQQMVPSINTQQTYSINQPMSIVGAPLSAQQGNQVQHYGPWVIQGPFSPTSAQHKMTNQVMNHQTINHSPNPSNQFTAPVASTSNQQGNNMIMSVPPSRIGNPDIVNSTLTQPMQSQLNVTATSDLGSAINQSIQLSTRAQQALNQGKTIQALMLVLQSIHRKRQPNNNQATTPLPADVIDHCMHVGRAVINQVFVVMRTSVTQRNLLVEELLQASSQLNDCEQSIWAEIREVLQRAFQLHGQQPSLMDQSQSQSISASNNSSPSQNSQPQPLTSLLFSPRGPLSTPGYVGHQPSAYQLVDPAPSHMSLFNSHSPAVSPDSIPSIQHQPLDPQYQLGHSNMPFRSASTFMHSPANLFPQHRTTSGSTVARCKYCHREWELTSSKDAESLILRNKQLKSKRDHLPFCKMNPDRDRNLAKRRAKKMKRTDPNDPDGGVVQPSGQSSGAQSLHSLSDSSISVGDSEAEDESGNEHVHHHLPRSAPAVLSPINSHSQDKSTENDGSADYPKTKVEPVDDMPPLHPS